MKLTLKRPIWAGPTALLILALVVLVPARAHEWASPSARAGTGPGRQDVPAEARWSGLLWDGVAAGAPAAPRAADCRRAPQPFDVPGPAGITARREPWPTVARAASGRAMRDAAGTSDAAVAAPPTAPTVAAMERTAPAPATRAVNPAAEARQRPSHEPVTAGVVDDNADFGEYLAYRKRWPQLKRRELDLAARVLVDVHDERGRPVPDARIEVFDGAQPVPLWARTDAGGRAWLMPQPDTAADQLEVAVSKGSASTRVRWRRGQKDQLQVRLPGVESSPSRLDLVFLVDATGSMGDEIDKLKRSVQTVADQVARLPNAPQLCFGLVAYRDRGDEFFVRGADLTHDLGAFQSMLRPLQAAGGGDYPEALSEALHTAVHRISWRGEGTARIVVLLADAPPHLDYGAPYYDQDLRAAQAKGIKVFSVGASGLDPQGEYIFRQMAQFTGGRFVFLTYDQARNPASGPGRETLHDVRNYSVETLDKLLVRLVQEEMMRWPG